MNLKLETKADYIKAFEDLYTRVEALENAKGGFFKPDIIAKMTKPLADAIVNARKEFLPLQKSVTSKKDGKTFAGLDDYIEATNKAFEKYGISVTFMENVEDSPTLVAIITLRGTKESYTITIDVKPANMTDPKLAIKYGFQNARCSVFKTITQLK
jgi:hypothetical protein